MDNPFKVDWHDLFYGSPDPECNRVHEFARWLRNNKQTELMLFHGTAAKHPVMEKGLLPTSRRRRCSCQSQSGYVYLSVFPGEAKTFGQFGYPGQSTVVYAVKVTVGQLRPDRDQLSNKRLWDVRYPNLRNCLEHSLVFGYGARVKGKIAPYRLTKIDV
jgi:hypothetical protein